MKTNLTLAISVVLSLSVLMAQLEDPSGRWLFRAVTDTGEQIPLLIVKVSSGGEAAEAAILSTSAPFDIRVQDIQMDSQSFQMILAAEEGPLTLRGTPRDGSLVGTIQGFAFDNHRFRADRTDLSELQKLPEPSQAELQDYGHSLRVTEPDARVAGLREFLLNHPDSPLKGQVSVSIFDSLTGITRDTAELIAAAEQALQASQDKIKTMIDVSRSLAREKLLLDRAETYARRAESEVRQESPSHGDALHSLGWVLLQKGQAEAAVDYLTRAYRHATNRKEVTLHLAEAQAASGDTRRARDLYLRSYVEDGNSETLERAQELHARTTGSSEEFHNLVDREYEKRTRLFEPGRYEGEMPRKVVLAELFTGAECGPCQAADYAFHGLQQHYPDTVLAILKYHLHVPGPDPMANLDAETRASYYGVFGTPEAVFNGVKRRKGGGYASLSANLFGHYKMIVQEQLEQTPDLALSGQADREDHVIRARIRVDWEGDRQVEHWRLRVALIEDAVHYTGLNRVHPHRQVVRKMLAGAQGLSIGGEGSPLEFELVQDLDELETELEVYLESFQEENSYTFREMTHTIDRENLGLLAFVQDDASKQVLDTLWLSLD